YLLFFSTLRLPPRSPLFPYTTLFRSQLLVPRGAAVRVHERHPAALGHRQGALHGGGAVGVVPARRPRGGEHRLLRDLRRHLRLRSEEHTSELQSRVDLVCRLLLEKKN